LQTNSTHKRLQPGSQITEPISAWKVTTINLAVKFMRKSPKNPCVLQCPQGVDNFSVARFFLKLVWQNGEDEKGYEH